MKQTCTMIGIIRATTSIFVQLSNSRTARTPRHLDKSVKMVAMLLIMIIIVSFIWKIVTTYQNQIGQCAIYEVHKGWLKDDQKLIRGNDGGAMWYKLVKSRPVLEQVAHCPSGQQ